MSYEMSLIKWQSNSLDRVGKLAIKNHHIVVFVWPTLNHTEHFLSKLGTLGIQICDQIIQLHLYIKKVENPIT